MIKDKDILNLSVRDLVSFSAGSGDIQSTFFDSIKGSEGTEWHQYIQKKYSALHDDYTPEYSIKLSLDTDIFTINLNGRIDGIIKKDTSYTIHEIKTTRVPIGDIRKNHCITHWAQAKVYAYMYCTVHSLESISTILTYYNPDTMSEKSFEGKFSIKHLRSYSMKLINIYADWQKIIIDWQRERNLTSSVMRFPYPVCRKGQKSFINKVYSSIKSGEIMFAQAPTGTGKTVSTLYPSVKSIGERKLDKIFYLTSKNITRNVACKSIGDMCVNGLRIKYLILTSKEKSCFMNGKCTAESCEYAKGYYNRARNAVKDIFEAEDFFSFEKIKIYAEKHKICPFEFSLDLSLWSDVIVCDYNYLFDPRVYLKRFFDIPEGNYCFLIDEAHNLVDRARDMYSSTLELKDFSEVCSLLINIDKKLFKVIEAVRLSLLDIKSEVFVINYDSEYEDYENGSMGYNSERDMKITEDSPVKLVSALEAFTLAAEKWLATNKKSDVFENVLDLYFKAFDFIRIQALYDEKFATIYNKSGGNFTVKLFCIDPSILLNKKLKLGRASVLFSATMSPGHYYAYILGGGYNFINYKIPSPFPKENLLVYIDDTISTKYKDRQKSYDLISDYILKAISGKTGNYMVFFPSFEYLEEVYFRFYSKSGSIDIIRQYPSMKENERSDFLNNFLEFGQKTLVGFTVLGGVFGEGIDLEGDKLSGVIVVGVGMPAISYERNVIRAYFDQWDNCGFDYSYIYPGINKVLQAVGRVIRTENDKGFAILIDERYGQKKYSELLPPEWQLYYNTGEVPIDKVIEDFWLTNE